jgi:murein biosynthesis integral membrane protein MurJ
MNDKKVGQKIIYGTIIIVGVSILSKFVSFISEAILAAYLGTSITSDAYYMVTSIQSVIYPMLSVGIWKIYLPVYKELSATDSISEREQLTNSVISVFTVVSIAVVVLLEIFSVQIVHLIAPGFDTDASVLCAKLLRMSAPMYIFIIASAIYAVMLQCNDKFFGSQIREVVSHIPTIVAAVFLYNKYGVESLAISLIIGGMCRLIIELPFVTWGYRYRLSLKIDNKKFHLMLKRLPSAFLSEGVNQLNTLVDKVMASGLGTGIVSALNYGAKLNNVFCGLLSSAIATALYPQVVELITLGEEEKLAILLRKIVNIFAMIMIPLTIGCLLYCNDIVSIVYQRGEFSLSAVNMTSGIFACYSAGLFFIGVNTVLTNVFYANGDTKTPMYISVTNMVTNVFCNLLFIHFWGAPGLAFATSVSAAITFAVRITFLKKIVMIEWFSTILLCLKLMLASIISCVIPWLSIYKLEAHSVRMLIGVIISISLYCLCMVIMRVSEFYEIMNIIKSKLKKGD